MLLSETGIAKRTVTALNNKKVYTVDDLLHCLPRKYLDYRQTIPISDAVLLLGISSLQEKEKEMADPE